MRVDASLVSLILAATASAQHAYPQPHSYNSTQSYNGTAGGHLISELEKEVAALRQKLEAATEAASKTCQAPGGAPSYGQSGASASGSASSAAAVSPPAYSAPASNGQTGAAPASSAAPAQGGSSSDGNSPGYYIHTGAGYPSETPQSEGSAAQTQPAGYAGQNSAANGGSAPAAQPTQGSGSSAESANNGASAQPATQQPAGYSAAPSEGASGAASSAAAQQPAGYGSSANGPASSPAQGDNGAPAVSATSYTTPDYYAPNAPESTSTNTITSTKTVIVTAGTLTVSESVAAPTGSSENGVYTQTETYHGTAPIPSPPSSTSSSAVSTAPVVGSDSSSSSKVISMTAPYGYGNGTSSGFLTGTAKVPVSTGTGASGTKTSLIGTDTIIGTGSMIGTGSATISAAPTNSANGTSTSTSSSASATASAIDCSAICSTATKFNDWDVTPLTCTQLTAGTQVNTPSGQSSVGCAASFTPALDICQVTLNVKTAGEANTYMEVWLPNGNSTAWNGRSMNTDNGGLNGCVHYVDMQYVSGLGFAAIGDNAGHNGSSFDGTWTLNNNQAIVDWAYRARHAAVDVGKQVIDTFYSKKPEYSYYIGCSAGGAQGLQSAQKFPNDFDGIIAGASANDFNHLQDWSAHFRQLTGASGNDTFLTVDEWTTVQSYIFDQCDEKLDGVNDGILEDPTICDFDVSAIPVCSDSVTSGCLDATQIETVKDVFKPLYNAQGALIYPPLLYGAQVDAFRLGLLSGSIQGIAQDWFRGGVYNDSSYDILTINQADYARADELDDLHGNPSAFNGDLSGLRSAGSKLIMYHGMADPMTSGYNSQRYYQKVAKTLGASNTDLDEFFRFFRISGMAHCGVGGISGAGAWMFGQSGAAAAASNNIVDDLVSWVENNDAPDVMLGTKFWYDTPSMGIEFERPHCRFPYRTTFDGGDSTKPENWSCKFIDNWQQCEDVTCSADGTFT